MASLMASAASAPTTAPINALPPGLLELIFRRFHRRPLLLIVSLVCRHWRRAALRTVTKLSLSGTKIEQPLTHNILAQLGIAQPGAPAL